MKKKYRNILRNSGIAVAGVAAVGAAACYTVASYLMKVAMDRDLPKVKNMEKAKAHLQGNSKESSVYRAAADAAKALECVGSEQVEVTGYDGETLVGHWQPVEHAKRVIIAMHGWRSSWVKDFGVIAPFWREEGCSVLYVEQRGQNGSGGDYIGFGMIERYDCMEWVKWVNAHNEEGLPVYLAGVSMGASTVLMAAGLELPDSIHGIIADCGYTSAHDIWKHVVENNLHLSYGAIGKITSDICRQKIQMGAQDYSTVEAMQTGKTPVLFIHGTDDHFVPVEMTYENYKACTAPKRLFVVPGADHGMSYATNQAGYQAALRSFWHDFDTNAQQ
jgi:fermentation-respiration switch protein FrsA (DUF1100 family)